MITRRTALKGLAAACMAPLVNLRPEIDRERILKGFCDDIESLRYGDLLKRPFGVGSLTYATDARHIVRTELVNRVEDGERKIPDVEWVWEHYCEMSGKFRPFELPPVERLTLHRDYCSCPLCGDRRVSLGPNYPEWGPNGEPADYELTRLSYDVDDNSIRDKSCPLCHGLTYHGPNVLEVCGVVMQYTRLKPIANIPNVMIAPSMREGALLFSGDGFEGIALGLRKQ